MNEQQEETKTKEPTTVHSQQDEEMQKIKELLHSKYTNMKKMTTKQLKEECQMWRNIWDWIPSDVKYYVSRTGQTIGVQIRNYKRFIGPLLETYWDLKEIEVGVYDKVYDQTSGEHFYERKVVKLPASQIVSFDWIAQRISETELQKIADEEEAKNIKTQEEQEPTET